MTAYGGQDAGDEACAIHDWTCIWCSMTPPICGSCRPTAPCPADGRLHACACNARNHARDQAAERTAAPV
jgi:hypothetical protein